MELHPVDILINLLNLIVLLVLLRLIVWKPMMRYLSARAARVQADLDGAEQAKLETEEQKAELRRNVEALEAQGREMVRESQSKASQEAQEIIQNAHCQADAMLTEAREKIEGERSQAITKARYEIAQIATDMASRILKREVSAEDNKSAVDDFFREAR